MVFASAIASQDDHGYEAGRYVAKHVRAAFQTPPSLLIAFIGERHNQAEVVRGIRSIDSTTPLIGSSAGGVISMAGVLQKGVSVLALRFDGISDNLTLETGLQSQPAGTAERAISQVQSSLSDAQQSAPAALLVLTDGIAGNAALADALQAASALVAPRCAIIGAAASTEQTSGSGKVFVNDQVAADGFAVGMLRSPVRVGIGLSPAGEAELTEGAAEAARQAVAALGDHSPAAALIFVSDSRATAPEGGAAPEVERIRDTIGRATPIVGMYCPGAIAARDGTPALQRETVLVCVIGGGAA